MDPVAWYIRIKVLSTSGWQDLQTCYLELLHKEAGLRMKTAHGGEQDKKVSEKRILAGEP